MTFCLFLNSHLVRKREAVLGLVPVVLYGIVYVIMVVLIGEEHGGWNDFYGFVTKVPFWVSLPVIAIVSTAVVFLLRLAHNACCLYRRKKDAQIYRETYGGADLKKVIEELARTQKREQKQKNPTVPVKMIGYMIEDGGSDLDVEEGARIYLDAWLKG